MGRKWGSSTASDGPFSRDALANGSAGIYKSGGRQKPDGPVHTCTYVCMWPGIARYGDAVALALVYPALAIISHSQGGGTALAVTYVLKPYLVLDGFLTVAGPDRVERALEKPDLRRSMEQTCISDLNALRPHSREDSASECYRIHAYACRRNLLVVVSQLRYCGASHHKYRASPVRYLGDPFLCLWASI